MTRHDATIGHYANQGFSCAAAGFATKRTIQRRIAYYRVVKNTMSNYIVNIFTIQF